MGATATYTPVTCRPARKGMDSATWIALKPPRERRSWRWALDACATVAMVAAVGLLAALGLGSLTGHQVLIDRSDSMQPTIAAGDLLVVRRASPGAAQVFDIVTFVDPEDRTRTVTHRVTERRAGGEGYVFVTKGDANTYSEEWTIKRDATLGITRLVVPKAGYAFSWFGQRWVRFAFITLASAVLGITLLRRIWMD